MKKDSYFFGEDDNVTIMRRTIINLRRNKMKAVILLLIITVIGSLIAGAILANQAIGQTINNLQLQIPLTVGPTMVPNWQETVDEDRLAYFENYSYTPITREMINIIGDLPYVQHFDYSLMADWMVNLTPGRLDHSSIQHADDNYGTFRTFGVSRPEMIYIESGMYELYEGRVFTNDELNPDVQPDVAPVLISLEVAEANGLWIGSTFEISNFIFMLPENANIPEEGFDGMSMDYEQWNSHPYYQYDYIDYKFEVIGIFNFTRIPRGSDLDLLDHNSMLNLFFTPNWRIYEMRRQRIDSMILLIETFNLHDSPYIPLDDIKYFEHQINPFWTLNSIEDLEYFRLAANEILPPYLQIGDLTSTFATMITSMNSLSDVINQAFWFGSGAFIIALKLLILLYLREKKHEIGIYLALGEKKIKIVAQILMEVFVVALVGLVLAFLIGSLVSEQISAMMLRNELANNARDEGYWSSMLEMSGFGQEMSVDELLEAFSVSLSTETTIFFFGIGLLIISLSTIVPVVYISELNVRDILLQSKVE